MPRDPAPAAGLPPEGSAADTPKGRSGGANRRRYRIFYVLAGQTEGRCELDRDAPISAEDLDGIERTLMGRLGCGNALVVGWQELDRRETSPGVAPRH